DQDPVWSPDGKRIAFTSDRAGTQNLYLRFADGGGNDELLLKTGERKQPRAWSPDGRFLLFGVASPKSLDVWVLPMDAGSAEERKPIPYLRTDANELNALFSPDGRFVAYESDESGTYDVYVRPFDPNSPEASGSGPGKVKVSQNGGSFQRWAPNGKELLFITTDFKLSSVDVTFTPELRVSAPRELAQLPRAAIFTIAPDAQRVLVGVPAGGRPQSAVVVLNWQAGLKK